MTATPESKPRTAWQDLSGAFQALTIVLLFISGGMPAVIGKLTSAEDWDKIFQILAVTLPFTLWVAITIMIAVESTMDGYLQAALAGFTLLVLTLIGNLIGLGVGSKITWGVIFEDSGLHPAKILGALITRYALAYGAATFLSAIAVGGFLGFCWWRLFYRTSPPPAAR